MRSFITCLLPKHNWNDRVKEDTMGRACSTNGDEECIWDIGDKARRKETTRNTKT
jgi:hypothetical protein